MSIPQGTRFGPYEIASRLGAGGMGEVYLARDTRLGRLVALKLLSEEFTTNRDRLARFKKEARATSALNHPNIVTIHEIGSDGSRHYIVTEFIEGVTVRKRLARGRVRWTEAVDVAIQIATALSAAHSHGIIHRDIKPENVMLRTDGYVKVLDFGLAKLMEPSGQHQAGPEDSTVTNVNTDPGTVVGTVAYMSPEQLRQQELDGQTDVWSLGVVLYEMIAGYAPFHQPTKSDLIVSILDREPPPLAHYVHDLPIELERIVSQALRKDRDERYQSAQELLEDLKQLKQAIDSETKIPRLHSGPDSGPAISTDPGTGAGDTAEKVAQTGPERRARATVSVEYILGEIKRGGVGALILIVGFFGVLIGGGFLVRALINRHTASRQAPAIEFVEIVKTGGIKEATISPDGNYLAVLVVEGGQYGISVRQVSNSNLVSIVPFSNDRCRGLVFSRDGSNVYYLKQEGSGWNLFRVAALGGTSRKICTDVSSPAGISPDGARLVFLRTTENGPAMFIAPADGGVERELTKGGPNAFGVMRDLNNGPAWSPDGSVIACPVDSAGARMKVALVSPADGSVKVIDSQSWYLVGQLAWLSDGSGLALNAVESARASATFQLWLLSYPSGVAHRITNDLNYYRGVSLTNSGSLLSMNRKVVSRIWLSERKEISRAIPIANSEDRGAGGIAWLPDGRIVYSVNGPGNENVWVMDANGSNARQLTFGENADVWPALSRDGRYIVFTSFRTGEAHVWRMNADGSAQRQLTFGKSEDSPQVTPDGKWILYSEHDGENESIWKVPVDGGEPVKLLDQQAKQAAISPDGKLLACLARNGSGNAPWQITILALDSGRTLKTLQAPASVGQFPQALQWSPDGQSLTYVVTSGDVANIWSQSLGGGEPRPVTDFKDSRIVAFGWSADGSKLACVRSVELHDLILIRNFKPQ